MIRNITTEDYGNRHHVTNITAVQQQSGNLEPTGKLDILISQNYGMIDIDELIND